MKIAVLFVIALAFVPILADAQEPQTSEAIKEDSPIKYVVGGALVFVIVLALSRQREQKATFNVFC